MTKRCRNCGWPNDDRSVRCEKCNASLEAGSPSKEAFSTSRESVSKRTVRNSDGDSLRRTVSENQAFGNNPDREEPKQDSKATVNAGELSCPNCGYPVRQGMRMCPDCGTPLGGFGNGAPKTGDDASHPGTVNPWMQPEYGAAGAVCSLKPVAWVGENVSHQPLTFSGESVILNRDNTDPGNKTITSAEQAELVYEGGEWYIHDKSALHTTFVLASQKIKLHKGDIIVLGNRLFEFN